MKLVVSALIILLVIIIFFKLIKKPIKLIFKLLLNTLLGYVILFIFNLIGIQFGFAISCNLLNAVVIGLLGMPGLILLIILKVFL